MPMIGTTRTRRRSLPMAVLPLAALALLTAGCGTHRPGDEVAADRASRSAMPVPVQTAPADFRCAGESAAPTAPRTADTPVPTAPPTDHYAENHGFMVPFPLHGQTRCDGLAAAGRVKAALEPLRKQHDFDPANTRDALGRLGYSPAQVEAGQDGPTGVSFLVDAHGYCLEGTYDRAATRVDAFGGYPDHSGCDRPTGGH